MATAILDQPAPTGTGTPGEIFHWYCCDENVAMCGADLTEVPITDEEEPICPACETVRRMKASCPVAGCDYGGVA